MRWQRGEQTPVTRKEQIEKRLEEIISLWLTADGEQRGKLLLERIRLTHELEDLEPVRS